MSSKELKKYRKYARNARWLLLPVGLWPTEKPNIAYRFLSAFPGVSLFILFLTAMNYCYAYISDLTKVTRGGSWCISIWTMLMKVILFVVHRERLLEINETLSKTFEKDLKNSGLESLLLQRLHIFTGIYYAMVVALFSAFTLFAVIPVMFIITHRMYLFVYPGKYPFTIEPGGTLYYIIYGYEAILVYGFFCIGCGTDVAFGHWIFQMCGQLRLLAQKFSQLRPGEKYAEEIRGCLDKHEMLMRCREHLQTVFGFIVIWLYVTISLVLCEYIYKMSKMDFKLSFWQMVMFFTFATKILQAFTYAFCGSILDIESEKVLHAIYDCHWPGSGDKQIMMDVLSLLSHKPMKFRSYNYFLLTMEMFLKIVNAAMSYFFLLRTFESS